MILTAGPSITKKEIDYVTDAITNGHGEHWGDYVHEFESSFAQYIGVKHAMATSSCTGALHLGLLALGIRNGDEVILPDMSWIASASVIRYVGATPVFVDIKPDTWCINPMSIIKSITPKTKAIMPVHLYGHPCYMDTIHEIANEYGLKIIEDAAPSVGAEFNGRKTGSTGDVAGFSFQGAKLLSTGEGGMFVTNNSDLYDRAKHFVEHGRSGSGFHISDIGYKYKMSNLQAAWGLAQIERVEELIARRREIYEWYSRELRNIEGISLNKEPTLIEKPIYWMTSVVFHGDVDRDGIMARLKDKGIDTRPFFPPMSSFPMFKPCYNPEAIYAGKRGINLPSGHNVTHDEVIYICNCLKLML